MQGKIIKGIAGFYYVDTCQGIYECRAKGIFRNQNKKPLVGDDVTMEVLHEADMEGNITHIEPRRNELIRPNVANVDQALVMFAAVSPEPHFGLLDRFLVMMEYQDVPAVICINKVDQGVSDSLEYELSHYRNAGYPVHYISAQERIGLEELQELLNGRTTVLAGASGVGKSSFLNVLSGTQQMEVGDVSVKLGRGRHTTRHSQIFSLWENTYVCDTPGFSSMDLPEIETDKIRFYFPEIDKLEGKCRFPGCVHRNEPDCAVKRAVAAGAIGKSRYQSYCDFGDELKNRRRRYD